MTTPTRTSLSLLLTLSAGASPGCSLQITDFQTMETASTTDSGMTGSEGEASDSTSTSESVSESISSTSTDGTTEGGETVGDTEAGETSGDDGICTNDEDAACLLCVDAMPGVGHAGFELTTEPVLFDGLLDLSAPCTISMVENTEFQDGFSLDCVVEDDTSVLVMITFPSDQLSLSAGLVGTEVVLDVYSYEQGIFTDSAVAVHRSDDQTLIFGANSGRTITPPNPDSFWAPLAVTPREAECDLLEGDCKNYRIRQAVEFLHSESETSEIVFDHGVGELAEHGIHVGGAIADAGPDTFCSESSGLLEFVIVGSEL